MADRGVKIFGVETISPDLVYLTDEYPTHKACGERRAHALREPEQPQGRRRAALPVRRASRSGSCPPTARRSGRRRSCDSLSAKAQLVTWPRSGLDRDPGAVRAVSRRRMLGAELAGRPGALREHVAQELEPRRARPRTGTGRGGRATGASGSRTGSPAAPPPRRPRRRACRSRARGGRRAAAARSRPRSFAEVAAELRLLLRHERVDLILHLRRARQAEPGIEAVALLVDPGAVHRDEQAGVRVLLRDRGDARAVEGEVGRDADLEEVDRLARRRRPAAPAPRPPSRRRAARRRRSASRDAGPVPPRPGRRRPRASA